MRRWTPQTVLYCSRLGELASKRPEPRQNTTHDDFCITFFPHGGQVGAVALSNEAAISVTFRQKSWWVVFCLC